DLTVTGVQTCALPICAAVELDEAGRNLEQRRFARSIAPDQAQPLAFAQHQLSAFEQRRAPEGQMNVLKLDQRRGHGDTLYTLPRSEERRVGKECRSRW